MNEPINAQTTHKLRGRSVATNSSSSELHSASLDRLSQELACARQELEENRIKTEAMINSLGEGLIVLNDHGEITTINAYALNALGYEEHELLGSWFPSAIVAVDRHSRPISHMARPIIRSLTSGQAVSDYVYYLKRDGTTLPVFTTVSPILQNDKPSGAIEVFRDLTKEQQLDVAKEEFVSLASHQLRTPATGVMTILSMLAGGDFGELNPLQQKYLEKAIRNNDRQLEIIEDMLTAARVDAGKMRLDLEYTDLAAVLRDAISDCQSTIAARNQTIRLQAPASCRLMLDAPKMRMVIDNLINNASKYSHPGSCVTVILRKKPETIHVSVRDEGVGIPKAEINRIFAKFTRLDNELSTTVGGTGLGLFLVRSLIELHHGTIEVSSREGEGSTFTIQLPIGRIAP